MMFGRASWCKYLVFVLMNLKPPINGFSLDTNPISSWVPISRADILSGQTRQPDEPEITSVFAPNLSPDVASGNTMKIVKPQELLTNFDVSKVLASQRRPKQLLRKLLLCEDQGTNPCDENLPASPILDKTRKPRLQNIQLKTVNNINSDSDSEKEEGSHINTVKNYKVSEDQDTSDLVTEPTDEAENIGYSYPPPQDEEKIFHPNTFTSTLQSILSKYNLNTQQRLKNYEYSRKQTLSKPPPGNIPFVYILPIPPHRYNSQNHLPVDPMIALYLSHFGFHIPGYHGVGGGYRNLYGYLASNNIHNNKPFGQYKLFSDTDSSN